MGPWVYLATTPIGNAGSPAPGRSRRDETDGTGIIVAQRVNYLAQNRDTQRPVGRIPSRLA